MAIITFDGLIARASNGYLGSEPIYADLAAATTTTLLGGQIAAVQSVGFVRALETYASGVTAYIPTSCYLGGSAGCVYMLAKVIDMGSLNIATPTFTDGSSMGTYTELGTAGANRACSLMLEVTTALNATPGNINVTYVDQDGNTAEATGSIALTASAAKRTCAPLNLNGTDWGVRDVTTATRTGGTTPTGVIQFWGVIPLGMCSNPTSACVSTINFLTSQYMIQRLSQNDTLRVFAFASAIKATHGWINYIGDN